MKSFLILTALLVSSLAQAEINKTCWDGTFGYNYARVTETVRGIEVSFSGNSLHVPTLHAYDGMDLKFGDWSHALKGIHAVLPSASKIVETDGTILASDKTKTILDWVGLTSTVNPQLWVDHRHVGLGTPEFILSAVPVESVNLKVTDDKVSLKISQINSSGKQKIEAIELDCATSLAPDDVALPALLVDHLNETLKTKE